MPNLFYPTDEAGIVIPVSDIGLPETKIPDELFDEGEPYVNNHHMYWEKAAWIGNAVLQKFRQLEINIVPLPIDVHRTLHQRYFGVRIGKLAVYMEVLEEQFESGGLIYPRNQTKHPRAMDEFVDMKPARRAYNQLRRYE